MILGEFKDQFGIGLIQLFEDKILGVSKLNDAFTFYALDIDMTLIPDNSEIQSWMDIIVTDTELQAVDSISGSNTELLCSVSLDVQVLGFEDNV
jgi:hypothetical protein